MKTALKALCAMFLFSACITPGVAGMNVNAGGNSVSGLTGDPIGAGYMAGDVNAQSSDAEVRAKNAEHCREMERRGRHSWMMYECGAYGGFGGGMGVYGAEFQNLMPPATPAPAPAARGEAAGSTGQDRTDQPASKAELEEVRKKAEAADKKAAALVKLEKARIQAKQQ